MPMPPHPPEDHNEPTDPDAGMPEDVSITDIGGRRLIVSPTTEGVILRGFHPQVGVTDILRVAHELGRSERDVRGMLTALNDRGHVVAELDRSNAHALSDAVGWPPRWIRRDLGHRYQRGGRARRHRRVVAAARRQPATARAAPRVRPRATP